MASEKTMKKRILRAEIIRRSKKSKKAFNFFKKGGIFDKNIKTQSDLPPVPTMENIEFDLDSGKRRKMIISKEDE